VIALNAFLEGTGFRARGMMWGLVNNYGGGGFDCNWRMGIALFCRGTADSANP